MNNKEWSKHILVRTNIVERLEKELAKRQHIKEIFIGSQSDPYMPLEEEYCLTRNLLEFLADKDYNIYMTTKATNRLILRDIELLKAFKVPITIIMGLSHIEEAHRGKEHTNIAVANELKRAGIEIDVHITPILPYIMKIDEMIQSIDKDINIYLDKLRIFTDGGQDNKIYEWIMKAYPEYKNEYKKIIFERDTSYYEALSDQYKTDKRVNLLFE